MNCPNCGHCPHCGRGGWYTSPAPVWPMTPYVPWTTTGAFQSPPIVKTSDYWDTRQNFMASVKGQ